MAAAIAIGLFTCAAAGILAALPLAPFGELGRFFFILNASLAFLLLCLAAPYRFSSQGVWSAASILALLAMVLVMAYVAALLALRGGRSSRGLLVTTAAVALATVAADGRAGAGAPGPSWAFGVNAVCASALLGSVIVGMLLGHWYLVRTRLDVSHLVVFARFFAAAVLGRAVLFAAGLIGAGAQSELGMGSYLRAAAIDRGFFFWQRILFGILGPGVFAFMVHETARMRSTQSATGILYIAVIFVMYGEFLARYLTVAGAGPM
ncbi:MAG TPA: hypothetical protein VGV60_08055 [Candidatus Polarisedimenticolia bacterium]|nr:hypothetical protein [Candidatus Polarisedimenticolia bacterium]